MRRVLPGARAGAGAGVRALKARVHLANVTHNRAAGRVDHTGGRFANGELVISCGRDAHHDGSEEDGPHLFFPFWADGVNRSIASCKVAKCRDSLW